jgi:hypothetical protein
MLREEQCRNPMYSGPEPTAYIRADLIEAAIKRALKGAAEAAYQWWDDDDGQELRDLIRALDPAQFIEEPKP